MVEPRTLRTHPELRSHQTFPLFKSLGEKPKNRLEKLLSLFADVRAGEGVGALLMAANVFLLLAGYYFLKTARESLILTEGSAEVKAYASAGQALVLLVVIPLYGWLGARLKRIALIGVMVTFFATNLILFAVLGARGLCEGVVFYIWLGVYNNFIVSQFWAFANDIYTEGQGRRLFPLIGAGSSLGAWLGAEATVPLVTRWQLSPYGLMGLAVATLAVCLALFFTVHYREVRNADDEVRRESESPLGSEGGFQLVFQEKYLFWIAALTVLLNVVNTSGEYLLSKLVVGEALSRFPGEGSEIIAARQRFIGGFMGSFFGSVNLLGFLLQLFATSRIIRYLGVRGALFILPCLALVNYSVIAVAPLLAIVRITKVLENSTDYSLQNTIRQALYLPTSREAKYKAKAAIDTFFVRAGDLIQAGIVRLGAGAGAGVREFAWLNAGLTVAWLWVAGRIAREHRRRTV